MKIINPKTQTEDYLQVDKEVMFIVSSVFITHMCARTMEQKTHVIQMTNCDHILQSGRKKTG